MSSSGPNAEQDTTTTGSWADLLPELCDLILDRTDAIGVIRFPAVCTAWAAASSSSSSSKNTPHRRPRLPSGAPTLLTSSLDPEGYDVEYDVDPGAFGIHDVATGKSYHGTAEGLKKRTWIGGKDDWLVTTDLECDVELLNPVTGVRVPLPSFATIPGVHAVEVSDRGPGICFSFTRWPSFRIRKVTLCRTPSGGYLAVALFSSDDNAGLVAFTTAASGDKRRWMLLKNPERLHYLCKYVDVTVHDGKVLAVDRFGYIYSWGMNDRVCGGGATMEPTVLPPPPDIDDYDYGYNFKRVFYLAKSSSGDLQLVCMLGEAEDTKEERWWRIVFDFQWSFWPRRVLLHELDAVTGAWRRVGDLGGDRALFVGANYPFYVDVPHHHGPGDPLLQADCVYVADLISCHAGVFDLKQGDDFEFNCNGYLSYPAMQEPLQMPMWFRPTAALPECTSARSTEGTTEERKSLLL